MEELVGHAWDRLITAKLKSRHPEAAVRLEHLERRVGILFRSAGGNPALEIKGVPDHYHGGKRGFWRRLAGVERHYPMAWRDQDHLYLPERIDLFPKAELNGDLYRWWAYLLPLTPPISGNPAVWFGNARTATHVLLSHFPTLEPLYVRLVSAHLEQRPVIAASNAALQASERQLRLALLQPHREIAPPPMLSVLWPIPLWPHPEPPQSSTTTPSLEEARHPKGGSQNMGAEEQRLRKRGQRSEQQEREDGLMIYRFEALLSWAEMIHINRPSDEEEDAQSAKRASRDMDTLTLTRGGDAPAKSIRFDLDLPAPALDDRPLGPGVHLPEWDYKRARLLPDHCLLQLMETENVSPQPLPVHLRRVSRRIQGQITHWKPDGVWLRRREEGTELDLEACLEHAVNRRCGQGPAEAGLWRDYLRGSRDLSTLLLADLSLSTDAWVNDEQRVIDVIRDALFIFAEALAATGDAFSLYGFSSKKRDHIRFNSMFKFSALDSRSRCHANAVLYLSDADGACRPRSRPTMCFSERFSLNCLASTSANWVNSCSGAFAFNRS
ncbi:putative nitric oxide reductase activation protein [Magnetococcus marinus MC-1]|uniref:Putative nitric oxide reductase activation protein n=1 Tax=Magnetococcus marinus (strain ATCC BAA-1437 / JCM 17883 / MC-1) TaxID=156889 RepID=A0L3V1_MAGMM|nr:putative nitric oxide reductase activation protein [Magnetococcus marinus MC-1]